MSIAKKKIRNDFNLSCLVRDRYRCICCGLQATPQNWRDLLDVHHISSRNILPNGGYTPLNGATVCKVEKAGDISCHLKAEHFHIAGESLPGYSPDDLYAKIGSSFEQALEAQN